MRRATKVASVRTTEPSKNFSRARNSPSKNLQPTHDQRMLIGHRNFRLAQQAPEPRHAFFATEIIPVRRKHLILQHRAITAEDDLTVRRVFADERDRLLHLM